MQIIDTAESPFDARSLNNLSSTFDQNSIHIVWSMILATSSKSLTEEKVRLFLYFPAQEK